MSQRHSDRPLVGEPSISRQRVTALAFSTAAGLVLARAIDASALGSLTATRLAVALGIPALTALALGGYDGWRLRRRMRAAVAADSGISTPGEERAEPAGARDLAVKGLVTAACVAAATVLFDDAAAFVLLVIAGVIARYGEWAVVRHLVRRHERRLKRRYFQTAGESDETVWLATTGLER